MTSDAERLRERIETAAMPMREDGDCGEAITRAIVEHGNVSWEMVQAIREVPISGMVPIGEDRAMRERLDAAADFLATLLEAAGAER